MKLILHHAPIGQAGRAAPWNFPWASPSVNPLEQPSQPVENSVCPFTFIRINGILHLKSKYIECYDKGYFQYSQLLQLFEIKLDYFFLLENPYNSV